MMQCVISTVFNYLSISPVMVAYAIEHSAKTRATKLKQQSHSDHLLNGFQNWSFKYDYDILSQNNKKKTSVVF